MKADKAQVQRLLKTARGQLDGILNMVEEDRYCLDVSNQLMATQSILKKANRLVLKAHRWCAPGFVFRPALCSAKKRPGTPGISLQRRTNWI